MYSGSFGVNRVPIFTSEEAARRGAIPPQPRIPNYGNGDKLPDQLPGFTLKIKDIAVCCHEGGIRSIFGKYGRIVDAKVEVNKDKDGNPMSGFGHVTFLDRAEAEAARELHGYTMDGMIMRVYPAYKASNLFVPPSPDASSHNVDYTESGPGQEFAMSQQFDYANSMNASPDGYQSNLPQSQYNATGGYSTMATAAGDPTSHYEDNNNSFNFNSSYEQNFAPNDHAGDGSHNSFINPYQQSSNPVSNSEQGNASFNEQQYHHQQNFTPIGHSGDGNNSFNSQYQQNFTPNGHCGDGNSSFNGQYPGTPNGHSGDGNNSFSGQYQNFTPGGHSGDGNNSFSGQYQIFTPNGHSGNESNSFNEQYQQQQQQTFTPNGHSGNKSNSFNEQYQQQQQQTFTPNGHSGNKSNSFNEQYQQQQQQTFTPNGHSGEISNANNNNPYQQQQNWNYGNQENTPGSGVTYHGGHATMPVQVEVPNGFVIPPTGTWGFINPNMQFSPLVHGVPGPAPHMTQVPAPGMTQAPFMAQSPIMTQAPPVMIQSPISTQAPVVTQSPIVTQAPLHAQPQPSLLGQAPGPLIPLLTAVPRPRQSTYNRNNDQSFPFRNVAMVDQPHPPPTVESLHRRQQNRGGVRSSGNRSPQRSWNGRSGSGNRSGQQGNSNNRNEVQRQDNARQPAWRNNNSRRGGGGGSGGRNNNGVNNYTYRESYDEQQQLRQMQYRDGANYARTQSLRQQQQRAQLQNRINSYDQHSLEEFPQLQMRRYTHVTNVVNYNVTLAVPPES